jgi:hypothetical protein
MKIPRGLALKATMMDQSLYASKPNNDLTVRVFTDDERRSGRQLFCNGTFNVKCIPICDGGTPIHVMKVALDHIEVAVKQNDSSGSPNTKQPESSWHRVRAATCQL